jgi:hypothetical protein
MVRTNLLHPPSRRGWFGGKLKSEFRGSSPVRKKKDKGAMLSSVQPPRAAVSVVSPGSEKFHRRPDGIHAESKINTRFALSRSPRKYPMPEVT